MQLNVNPASLRDAYRAAEPFPHTIIDGLFRDADIEAILRDFPSVGST